MTLRHCDVSTPWGPFRIVARDGSLVRTRWIAAGPPDSAEPDGRRCRSGEDPVLESACHQVEEYLAGKRRHFELPLAPDGTDFQAMVWRSLQDIPFGETRSYGDVAFGVGRPGAARAVGQANRRNPFPLLVPCHRVVTSSGEIGGYMGRWVGDDSIKACLLQHEARFGP